MSKKGVESSAFYALNENRMDISDQSSEEEKSHININSYLHKGQRAYEVWRYHENCDEENQISYIIPLAPTTPKYVLFIFLNIITLGIINIFLEWFPKLILYIYFDVTDLKSSTDFGIFSKCDNEFEVVEKKVIDLPQIDNSNNGKNIIKKFNLNIEPNINQIITFEYKYFKYLYSSIKDNFEAISYFIDSPQKNILEDFSEGLNSNEVLYMGKIFGKCDIDIKINSCGHILFDELTDPYYLFLLYSLILWFCLGSYIYALIIMALDVICFFLSVKETYGNLKKIQELSRYSCPVKVFRNKEKIEINSTELVPGDVFEIPSDGFEMPCDAILINGEVILEESKLTGDSHPVNKEPITANEEIFNTNHPEYEKYVLFAGTKIIYKRKMGISKPKGIVYRTGFETVKGDMISNILNSDEDDENFTRDSIKYIIIMGILTIISFSISLKFLIVEGGYSAYDVVIYFLDLITDTINPSLPTCLSMGITYSLSRLKRKGFFSTKRYKINKAGSVNMLIFDKTGTLTEDHLDVKGFIYTQINKNGQFEFNDFTENCEKESNIVIEYFKQKEKFKNWNRDLLQYFIECLACCHSLIYYNEKHIGDPVDVQMFESIGWILKENTDINNPLVLNYITPKCEEELPNTLQNDNNNHNINIINPKYEITIVKRFNLESNLQRMTVITKNPNENYFKVFCKGSPETIKNLCNKTTIPTNFDEILNIYTNKGYRVLGLAAKSININLKQSQILIREQVENNMIFLGFLIIENKLKEKTAEFIEKFDNADLGMIVVTGDNLRTAICVSKECNLIKQNQEMVICEIEDYKDKIDFKWTKLENGKNNDNNTNNNIIENITLNNELNDVNIVNNHKNTLDQNLININTQKTLYELYPPENINFNLDDLENNYEKNPTKITSVTSYRKKSAFDKRVLTKKLRSLTFNNKSNYLSELSLNRLNSPFSLCKDENFLIVTTGPTFEYLYKINQRYIKYKNPTLKSVHEIFRLVLKNGKVFARMIPENKALLIEALKQEGFTTLMCGDGSNDCLALREADVSVSLSPEKVSFAGDFNSEKRDISCIYDLLREGKCSLTTSIQTFKYMMLYSMIQSICVVLVAIYTSEVTDNQFLITDIFLIFPLELFLSMTKPYFELTYHYPIMNLISFPIIFSILIHTLIVFSFQFGGYKILKKYYKWKNICDFDDDDSPLPCHENTIFFLISIFQYTGIAISFFVSKPFRQRIFTNWILMIYLAGIYFYCIWITINCDGWSQDVFNIHDLEKKDLDNDDDIIKGGKKMKYFVFLIAVINTLVNNLFEWGFMILVRRFYEKNEIKNFKREILKEKEKDERQNEEENEIEDVEIYKYNRVYYYDRRIEKKSKRKK